MSNMRGLGEQRQVVTPTQMHDEPHAPCGTGAQGVHATEPGRCRLLGVLSNLISKDPRGCWEGDEKKCHDSFRTFHNSF